MGLLWTCVSGLLAVEVAVLLILCAPLPWGVRKNISRFIFKIKAFERLNALFKYICFGLFLALTESINAIRTVHIRREFQGVEGQAADVEMQKAGLMDFRLQKARAERNVYLASFSIICIVAIYRLVRLVFIEVQLRNKIKQYNGDKIINEYGETIEEKTE